VRSNSLVKNFGKVWCAIAVATSANFVYAAEESGVTRYVRFTDNMGTHSGILEGDSIRVLDGDPVFEDGVSPTGRTVELSDVVLEIPMNPERVPNVMGVAGNSNNPNGSPVAVNHPRWFGKANTSLAKNGAPVEVPFGATNFNFEGELGLIIGREGRHIPESEAMDYLFGVTVGNDWSENDWCGERRGIEEPTHVFCKAGDTFATLGDAVVTGLDLGDLQITVRLDGVVAAQGTSADFRDHPEIKANYLSTELDRRTMVDGMKLLLRVFQSEALAGSITSRLSPGAELGDLDDDALLEYIRQEASTVYHPTSTCSIGKVVDENLLVKGLDGLSVVDASVMPYVVSGNTNAATIMVAEKNADYLVARAK